MLKQGESFDEESIPSYYKSLIYETIRTDLKVQAGYVKPSDNLTNIQHLSVMALLRARNKDMADENRKREADWQANKYS
jgi:hypothetical protein